MAVECQPSCVKNAGVPCVCNRQLVTAPQANCSPLQCARRRWQPVLPKALRAPVKAAADASVASPESPDAAALAQLFPKTWGQQFVKLAGDGSTFEAHAPLRLGVVLSGGQAAGGHNVIAGIYDYVKQCNAGSTLYGFRSGPHGIFTHNYVELNEAMIYRYRNMGGFDMICSGRHKIETEEQKAASMAICSELRLDGLVIIGGDDSNTNGAVLAEYFKEHGCATRVVGAPKTIDGDLKNEYIEISFGFDTAIKVYSELVGNLCADASANDDRYYFIRLMGRSASNIGLEVALQTRANLSFVGEEVQAERRSLASLSSEIADMVEQRHAAGLSHGVVLLPEGLIEFIPEVGQLIGEINDILGDGAQTEFDPSRLTAGARAVYDALPDAIRAELLLERDSHGNVQVAKIATERLLILMTQDELKRRKFTGAFFPQAHYFGYEGRCALPSNFDSNYCYALGHTAAALVDNNLTGYMAVVRHLDRPASEWEPAGCPVTIMMNMERRKGREVPVIKKYLVELDKAPFTTYKAIRDHLKIADHYRVPGPIQFEGPSADITNYMICPPDVHECLKRVDACVSHVYEERIDAPVAIPATLKNGALTAHGGELSLSTEVAAPEIAGRKIGVLCVGAAWPGTGNVFYGIRQRLAAMKAEIFTARGVAGLLDGGFAPCATTPCTRNRPGFPHSSAMRIRGKETQIKDACSKMDAVIFLGDARAYEEVSQLGLNNSIFVPISPDNGVSAEADLPVNVGFDTVAKTFASLVGNLLTDAASAHKYWYFVQVAGSATLSLELTLQTHTNHCLVVDQLQSVEQAVEEIAAVVCSRAQAGKNFGCVLIPEGLMRSVEPLKSGAVPADYPDSFRQALQLPSPSGFVEPCDTPVAELMAALVAAAVKRRSDWPKTGAFAPVTYSMNTQGRSAIPSPIDCSLGECHGHLAALAAAMPHEGMMITAVGAVAAAIDRWALKVLPQSAITTEKPTYPASALAAWRSNRLAYSAQDLYCNPGPVQFVGNLSDSVSQTAVASCGNGCLNKRAALPHACATDISDSVVQA